MSGRDVDAKITWKTLHCMLQHIVRTRGNVTKYASLGIHSNFFFRPEIRFGSLELFFRQKPVACEDAPQVVNRGHRHMQDCRAAAGLLHPHGLLLQDARRVRASAALDSKQSNCPVATTFFCVDIACFTKIILQYSIRLYFTWLINMSKINSFLLYTGSYITRTE